MAVRSISCVYCGGAHATADEVRACWVGSQGEERGAVLSSDDRRLAAPAVGPPRATISGSIPAGQRGPAALGRSVLVAPGQPAPSEWADVERVHVTLDAACVGELRAAAHARRAHVLEIGSDVAPESLGPGATTDAPHEVGPRHTFLDETLRHLLVANSVDARGDGSTYALLDLAVAAGARPVTDGLGDVELPDGTRVWLDGGPPRYTAPIDGVAVLHRVAVEHGSLRPPDGNDTAADLSPDQLAAVTHDTGAARIIAPAGSGKTRVLTERARHLLRRWNLPPSAVCLVAFNKRAQEEMVVRTADLRGLQVRTLNAIALAIINGSPPFASRPARLATIDEPAVRTLIGKLVSFPRKRNADPVAVWIEALSRARLGLAEPDDVEAMYDGDVAGFGEILPKYRAALARAGQVDFDEQIQLAIELLLANPAVRATAQRACRVLLVDEFQDLTPAHLLLVRLLAGPDGAVFGVGDDDQTIYGYNGADPAWLIDFADLFPGAGDHPLEVNYRCPGGVVRAADTLLRHNRRRVPKVIRSAAPESDGFEVATGADSLANTADAVTEAIGGGTPPADIAVLTRVNALLAPVQVALHGRGIPTAGGVGREFLDRTAIRAALAWLRLAVGGATLSSADVGEALRRPSRSLHPRVADWVGEQSSLGGLQRLAGRITNDRDAATVAKFGADIETLQRAADRGATSAQLLAEVFEQIGLAGSIAQLDGMRRGMNRSAQNDDLTSLAQLASLQPDPAEFESWLRRALDAGSTPQGVTLATVHRVKGQEWPFVVVHHAADDQFPHRLATDVEEERRLFHVAITRAARRVLVVPAEHPSPFILDCSTEPSARRPEPTRPATPARPAATATAKPGHGLDGDDLRRFEALRDWRRHAASGKPAFTVFADATLDAIARANPTSLDQLARIKGIGPAKLEQYGESVLRVVADT